MRPLAVRAYVRPSPLQAVRASLVSLFLELLPLAVVRTALSSSFGTRDTRDESALGGYSPVFPIPDSAVRTLGPVSTQANLFKWPTSRSTCASDEATCWHKVLVEANRSVSLGR